MTTVLWQVQAPARKKRSLHLGHKERFEVKWDLTSCSKSCRAISFSLVQLSGSPLVTVVLSVKYQDCFSTVLNFRALSCTCSQGCRPIRTKSLDAVSTKRCTHKIREIQNSFTCAWNSDITVDSFNDVSATKKSILSLRPLFFKEYFLPEFGQDENLLQTFAILASSVSKLGYPILPQKNRRTSIIPLILPKQFHPSTSMRAKKWDWNEVHF